MFFVFVCFCLFACFDYYFILFFNAVIVCSILENNIHKSGSKSIEIINFQLCCWSCMILLTPVIASITFFSYCAITDLNYRVADLVVFSFLVHRISDSTKAIKFIQRVSFVL